MERSNSYNFKSSGLKRSNLYLVELKKNNLNPVRFS